MMAGIAPDREADLGGAAHLDRAEASTRPSGLRRPASAAQVKVIQSVAVRSGGLIVRVQKPVRGECQVERLRYRLHGSPNGRVADDLRKQFGSWR
jgi:hypothetical protein